MSRSRATSTADRVRRSHAQTRTTLRLALGFFATAAVVAVVAAVRDWSGGQWLALHTFFAGGVVLAISGVSLMLTVTWSAAPAPGDRWATTQRCCVAFGAAAVALGRHLDAPRWVLGVAGVVYVAGLVMLGVLLVVTVRRGSQRRFDTAVAGYGAAVAAGVLGVGLGVAMATMSPVPHLRDAHLAANVLGLVGLVVASTLPYFAATVGRSKMAPLATRARLAGVLGWLVAMLAAVVAALVVDAPVAAGVALGGYAVGIVATVALMPRPTRRQMQWSGPRLVGLWAGAAWWVIAVVAGAIGLVSGEGLFTGWWLLVMVVAGYGQVLWGSLAYLLPMLRGGGHEHLGAGFATTRSWVGLAAVNVTGLALALGWGPAAAAAAMLWVADAAWGGGAAGAPPPPRPPPPTTRSESQPRSAMAFATPAP